MQTSAECDADSLTGIKVVDCRSSFRYSLGDMFVRVLWEVCFRDVSSMELVLGRRESQSFGQTLKVCMRSSATTV